MEAAPGTEQGTASGLLATARITGQALSVAVAGAVFLGVGGSAGAALLALQASGGGLSGSAAEQLESTFLHGFHASLTVCSAFAALGALVALVRGEEERSRGSRVEDDARVLTSKPAYQLTCLPAVPRP
jgi:hypothetical protein